MTKHIKNKSELSEPTSEPLREQRSVDWLAIITAVATMLTSVTELLVKLQPVIRGYPYLWLWVGATVVVSLPLGYVAGRVISRPARLGQAVKWIAVVFATVVVAIVILYLGQVVVKSLLGSLVRVTSSGSSMFVTSPGLSVRITSPVTGEYARDWLIVRGTVSDPNAEVWVIVRPMRGSKYWVQPPINVRRDRTWAGEVYIGAGPAGDVGKRFEIYAVTDPIDELRDGDVLCHWPKAKSSDVIEVIKK